MLAAVVRSSATVVAAIATVVSTIHALESIWAMQVQFGSSTDLDGPGISVVLGAEEGSLFIRYRPLREHRGTRAHAGRDPLHAEAPA